MGWCSGSDIWYPVAKVIIQMPEEILQEQGKVVILTELIKALLQRDWDCYGEDELWDLPVTQEALKAADPKLYERLKKSRE